MMSLSKIIQKGYSKSRNGFRKDTSTVYSKKSFYNNKSKRFYTKEQQGTQSEGITKRTWNYVKRRNFRYALGGSIAVVLTLISEISEMRSIDHIEGELLKNHEKIEDLNTILFSAHMYLRDYKATRRFKDVKKVSDALIKILSNSSYADSLPRVYSLICLSLLCDHSKQTKEYIVNNIDFVRLSKFIDENAANEDEVKAFREIQSASNTPSSALSKKVLIRKFYERLLYHACEVENVHPQLLRANIVPFTKTLIDDSNGEFLFAAQYLKHISNSERGARELWKEDLVPTIYDKLFSKDSTIPEWSPQGSVSSESIFLKAQDFLINMTKTCSNDFEKKYPEIYNHLNEASYKGYRSFEQSVSTIKALSNAKYILLASVLGMTYGSIRTLIHNYRFPELKKSVLRRGALPAAAASTFAIFVTMVYDSAYKAIWSDERLHVLLRLFFVSSSLTFFYSIGSVAPYSIVPYAITYGFRAREHEEFDTEGIRKGMEMRDRLKSKKTE